MLKLEGSLGEGAAALFEVFAEDFLKAGDTASWAMADTMAKTIRAALPSGAEPVAPREPTADMLRAGMDDLGWWVEPYEAPRESGVPTENDMSAEDAAAINSQQIEVVASCYRAMVAAAPQSSSQVTEERIRQAVEAFSEDELFADCIKAVELALSDEPLMAEKAVAAINSTRAALSPPVKGDGQ